MRFSLIGVLIGIIFWVFDAAIDSFIFHAGDFFSMIFSPSGVEILNRLLMIIFLIIVGAVYAGLGTANFKREIKRLKDTGETLQKNHHLLRAVIEGINEAVYVKDFQGRYSMINAAGARILGKSVEDVIGKDDGELFSPETAKNIMENDHRIMRSGDTQTYEDIATAAGVTRNFLTTKAPYRNHQGNIIGVFGISRDITERKLSEEQITSEHAFRKAIEDSLLAGIAATDLNGRIIYVNPAFCRMVGWKEEELLGSTPPFVFWPPEEIETIMNIFQKRLSGIGPRQAEHRFLRRNGERFHVLVLVSPLTDGQGKVTGILGSFYDITDRKRAEEELRRSNQMLQGLVQASPLAIMVLDQDGIVRMWSPAAEHIFGWQDKEVLGRFLPAVPDDKRQEFLANLESVIRGKDIMGMETRRQKKGGIPIEVSLWAVPLSDSQGGRLCLSIVADFTEKRRMEEELLKIQKLESLGLFAGGIAHDFNNILTGILGNISLARALVNPEDRLFKRLTEAERASLRATELARQLLTFSKGGAPVKKTASIKDIIENSVQFTLRGSNVRSQISIKEGFWPVEIDEGQISQVIQNLVINAQQAMPEGGTIQIKAENLTIGENQIKGLSLRKGNYVKISIQDKGIGIPKENLSKIFDPYYTTKPKGSGLGLSISYSIIQRHDGYITVESEPGAGTTFFLYLPASFQAFVPQREGEEGLMTGSGRVLVMDDEESVLEVAGEMLKALGYEVDLACGGAEAVSLYKKTRESGQPYDVVVTDLTVPGDMGGVEVLQRLRELDPHVKVIVSSGYSNDPVMADFKTYGFSGFIMKPYSINDLGKTLHNLQ